MMTDGATEEGMEDTMAQEDDILPADLEGCEEEEEQVEDMSDRTLARHTGSVFCVAISHSEQIVLTGGEDDIAFVWNLASEGEDCKKIEGHKDSVTHVGFSVGDKYYFTADLSGFIQVFEGASHSKIWDFDVGDVLWVLWHPVVPILLAGTVSGGIWMWKVPSFETKTIQLSSAAPVDATFLSTNRHLLVGFQDGALKVVDLKSGEASLSVELHREITSVGRAPDDGLLLAGAQDSSLTLVSGSGKLVGSLREKIQGSVGHTDDSVEHIAFHPKRPLVATSYVKDRVCLWDTAVQRLRATLPHPEGVVRAEWAGDADHHLVTCCLDGTVRVWDVDRGEVLAEVTGHTAQLLDMKISENLVVTSDDAGLVKVFRIS